MNLIGSLQETLCVAKWAPFITEAFIFDYLLENMAAADLNFGGYDFESKSETNYECPICKKIIRQFTELPCHHFACRACLEYWERQQRENHQQRRIYESLNGS